MWQFRQFKKCHPKQLSHNDFDLYFVKPKAIGVGVKARFNYSQKKHPQWQIHYIEVKLVKNHKQRNQGLNFLQHWKKVHIPCQLTVYPLAYIVQHLQKFKKLQEYAVKHAVAEQLKDITTKLKTIIKQAKIAEKHFDNNSDLVRWINDQDLIVDIFMVEKDRRKSSGKEEGYVRVTSLFQTTKFQKVYQTQAFEHKKEEELRRLLAKEGVKSLQNISYPSLLQRIISGMM